MMPARGFSLVDLMVALACTGLLAAAVSTLLVGAADGARHAWAAERARGVAGAAIARVAADVEVAGFGLERADAVLDGGVRVPGVGSGASGRIRVLRALGAVLEIGTYLAPGSYEVTDAGALAVGGKVAAIDLAGRPVAAPLPVGTVVGVASTTARTRIDVAWPAAAAALLAAWGEPRALLPIRWRDYESRPWRGALQLRRRDEGGSWQPVVDGLTAFRVVFAIDADGDGLVDRSEPLFQGDGRLCGVRVEAEVVVAAHRASVTEAVAGRRQSASRWIGLPWC